MRWRSAAALTVGWLIAEGCGPTGPTGPGTHVPGDRTAPRRSTVPRQEAEPGSDRVRAALGKNIRQYRRRMRRCHELAMADDFRVGGVVALELLVRPLGVVTAARTLRNTTGSKLLAACLKHVAQNFVFPATDGDHRLPVTLRFAAPSAKLTVQMDDVAARAKLGRGVSAKVLLTPRSVSGNRVSLVVLQLKAGATVAALRHRVPMGLYVLQGALAVAGDAHRVVLQRGESGVVPAGRLHGLAAHGTGTCAVLVFFLPAGPEGLFLTGQPTGGSRRASAGANSTGPLVVGRLASPATTGPVSISRVAVPSPQGVAVAKGHRAVINPAAKKVAHALLVTGGAFWITIRGVKIPAGAGMAVYVPAGLKAEIVPAGAQGGTLVVQPWTARGAWSQSMVHPLVLIGP